jgi:hypothetical protein
VSAVTGMPRREKTLQIALTLSKAGIKVFPCLPFSKAPATKNGFHDATTDEDQVRAWFDNDRGLNLAVHCGPQPCGINLLAVDIDPKNGGLETWKALTDEHGVPLAPRHETPSGGFHLFFDAPEGMSRTGPHTLGQGIDTRDGSGYVVVPPSQLHNEDGEIIVYRTSRESALALNMVPAVPLWLMHLLMNDAVTESQRRHPSQQPVLDLGDSVADLAKEGWDWHSELEADGWVCVFQRGDQSRWTRPGKNPREGSSATLHEPDGPFVTFSSSLPPGRRRAAGAGEYSFSPWDYIVTFRAGGDNKMAARLVRGEGQERAAPTTPTTDDATPQHRLPVVPDEYWSASERNRQIFLAARAAMVSPDALDLVMFALESTLIPPSYLLPRIVGGQQPLNFLACLVAPTGLFKTSTLDAARDLMGPTPPWVVQIGMGSGEGIGATFLEDETEVNARSGKTQKTGRLKRNSIQAAFFEADEGSGLTEQAGRAGATVIANLCKAWSGSTLGEANADPTKRRHVLDRDYRIAALVNIQPSNFAGLFSIANTGTGLTGRFMFSGTADYSIPDDDVEWPGRMEHPRFPQMPLTLEIDERIISAAKAQIRARHRAATLATTVDEIGQNAAVIARMAGISVLVDDRRRITEDDWALAEMRARTSAACLQTLAGWSASVHRDRWHTQAVAKAEAEIVVEDVKDRQGIARMAEAIRRRVVDGPVARGQVRKAVSSTGTRHRFEAALALAVSNGWVKAGEVEIEHL